MRMEIPELSLVLLIGPSASGKSTFAASRFLPTEVVSSDRCRALIADDENVLDAISDGFDLLHQIVDLRLKRGLLTVVDATNTQKESRRSLIELAAKRHVQTVGIIFDLPTDVLRARHEARTDRGEMPFRVVERQSREMKRSLRHLSREGIRQAWMVSSQEQADGAGIVRVPMPTRRLGEMGPFDIIGDVHGCLDELLDLLKSLGWEKGADGWSHPEGRRALFVGDLVDRGPDSVGTLRLAMEMCAAGRALCVPGNHDDKLKRWIQGRNVSLAHGLAETVLQMEALPDEERQEMRKFIDELPSHLVLDGGRLVVAHAGMPAEMQGRAKSSVRAFALYGDTTGEIDEYGLPVRLKWAEDYRGSAFVAFGHTPTVEPEWLHGTVNLDTGCVFGGRLTALRWPEKEIVQVEARRQYAEPARPPERPAPAEPDSLDIAPFLGRLRVATRLQGTQLIDQENAAAALETMGRYGADPRWVIHLPPTMSPSEAAPEGTLLERPDEALAYFAQNGADRVCCQEKHMGSRALAVVCRSEAAAARRFGVVTGEKGRILTRTGRGFFQDFDPMEDQLLEIISQAAEDSGLWNELESDWMILDAELMPWSAKAQGLIDRQFRPAGEAATAVYSASVAALPEGEDLRLRFEDGLDRARRYEAAWQRYVRPVAGIRDLRFAPFHLLASEGAVHLDRPHSWHLGLLDRLCRAGEPVLQATSRIWVDPSDPGEVQAASEWWAGITEAGSEGMVVKPEGFLVRAKGRLIQPALKCRGREYLRIIYGFTYDREESLALLRRRGLAFKRRLALKELALGHEALCRFVDRRPLQEVHECALAVLALESQPVDARL